MMYEVLDQYCYAEVSDEDIEKAVAENDVPEKIMQAMGQTHREEYMKYILPYLDHEYFYVRRRAIQAILNVNGELGLEALKKKCEQYSFEDEDPWNKLLLTIAIMMVEEGVEGRRRYFISEEGDSRIKDSIMTFYGRGYQYELADVEFICFYIRSYIDQSFEWIKKLKKRDRNESIYFAFDSLLYVGEGTNVLSEISDELSEEICKLCEEVIEKKLGDNPTYSIAITSQYMRREYAVRILKALKDRVKSNAKKEFKKSLKKWNIDVEEL